MKSLPRSIQSVRKPVDRRASRPPLRGSAKLLVIPPVLALCAACLPEPRVDFQPVIDLEPPLVLEAGPQEGGRFSLRFNEPVSPIPGSFLVEPGGEPEVSVEEEKVSVTLPRRLSPGAECLVSGEVEDSLGNGSRFLFRFVAWNENPALLRISEVQAAKNSSASRPHRDFVEFWVEESGNLGGMELFYASSSKLMSYRFPGADVARGEYLVVHCAPQGLPEERDELGTELSLSGGVDSSPARDLWNSGGGLPDEAGLIALFDRPGGAEQDILFYRAEGRTGIIGEGKLAELAQSLSQGKWRISDPPSWEDAFPWKPSASRALDRTRMDGFGLEAWAVGASGSQSPGRPRPETD